MLDDELSNYCVGLGQNIIVQLFEYWERIPWFVYTLIAGLGIIFYVTYKEFSCIKFEIFKIKSSLHNTLCLCGAKPS